MGNLYYYVITCNEDGDVCVDAMRRDELERRLQEKNWGDDPQWVDALPAADPQYWRGKSVIIRGSLILPKPVDVVQRWAVE